MQSELTLQIASRLISGLLCQERHCRLPDRVDDIRHALEVAAEMMRQYRGGSSAPPAHDYVPPTPAPTLPPPASSSPPQAPRQQEIRTREAVVVRDIPSVEEWRKNRRGKGAPDPEADRKKPTLH
ncbi:hypothetical protein [Xanthomonas sp. LMG 12459]|uniref:hypothetical protein n=1 Tax=Xanthomonas sp. LMG 12459 TaxID=1591131 RepID=UPI001262C14E|nr:hypothetical protein [Xanthomonas sp. LMG 12459]KAB7776254.1 hypothetical protein CEK65_13915 [Xanthomonas sp. LMG 12459]